MSNKLQHMAYECKGLHGPGVKSVCEVRSPGEELFSVDRIIIPIFQRRYCWTAKVVTTLLSDAMDAGATGRHAMGKAIFVPGAQDRTLVCVDGQQRLTTVSLLVAAVARVARARAWCDELERDQLLAACQALLWSDEPPASGPDGVVEGEDVPSARLSPSYPDRAPFFTAAMGGDPAGRPARRDR
ncbi:uncharacterized protein AMSG_11822 [Thecamonas trahens ATCC 50062]|uniref:GmrSD restriction endonucleases N-terminal domain-containing protein n=1 Tax=Thecamonas trahens ATCC 50062 TaxID=461836 RepID=A0A0L0D7M1_THETB|nr:hypothetical protein AMSG_11822 [Thecamonas trahens ATCC 50062]KNC48354.1 hypothetical protein AMSG_11822 [Thecamonas trahens ATCC 50062]|eukprot:XP_013758657.1 hypothetical protein AMSG_11822 [Thecamonas trahens ATCC 50062]